MCYGLKWTDLLARCGGLLCWSLPPARQLEALKSALLWRSPQQRQRFGLFNIQRQTDFTRSWQHPGPRSPWAGELPVQRRASTFQNKSFPHLRLNTNNPASRSSGDQLAVNKTVTLKQHLLRRMTLLQSWDTDSVHLHCHHIDIIYFIWFKGIIFIFTYTAFILCDFILRIMLSLLATSLLGELVYF